MSEERLQEIKDSVNFQREILLAHNMGTLCVDEEQELIEEIERLNNIINKALELIYANAYDTEREECIDDLWGNIEELVDILKGSDKE